MHYSELSANSASFSAVQPGAKAGWYAARSVARPLYGVGYKLDDSAPDRDALP